MDNSSIISLKYPRDSVFSSKTVDHIKFCLFLIFVFIFIISCMSTIYMNIYYKSIHKFSKAENYTEQYDL